MVRIAVFAFLAVLFFSGDALAVQEHANLEGFYAHQFAHIFFLAAMAYMVAVIKKPTLDRFPGWRLIRISALFFLLWNADTFVNHFTEAALEPKNTYFRDDGMLLSDGVAVCTYITRSIENFLLVAAFILLALGLWKLKRQIMRESS